MRVSDVPINIYVTDRDTVFRSSDGAMVLKRSVEEAMKSPECRPAEQDPEGHWGAPTNGFQLSLRLSKTNYSCAEPIEAMVYLRNLTTNLLIYPLAFSGGFPLTWRSPDGGVSGKEPLAEPAGILSSMGPRISPRTQREFPIGLDGSFASGAPGAFIISVRTRVPRMADGKLGEVTSGEVTIEIGCTNSQQRLRSP
jgi:hypothetical protein